MTMTRSWQHKANPRGKGKKKYEYIKSSFFHQWMNIIKQNGCVWASGIELGWNLYAGLFIPPRIIHYSRILAEMCVNLITIFFLLILNLTSESEIFCLPRSWRKFQWRGCRQAGWRWLPGLFIETQFLYIYWNIAREELYSQLVPQID